MAGTEPLNEDGSPPHPKARKSSKARDGGKDGQKKTGNTLKTKWTKTAALKNESKKLIIWYQRL